MLAICLDTSILHMDIISNNISSILNNRRYVINITLTFQIRLKFVCSTYDLVVTLIPINIITFCVRVTVVWMGMGGLGI